MLRVIFYSVGIFRTSSLGDSILSNPERTATRSQGEEPVYIEVLQQRAKISEGEAREEIKSSFN